MKRISDFARVSMVAVFLFQMFSGVWGYGVSEWPKLKFRMDVVGGLQNLSHDSVPATVPPMKTTFPAPMSNVHLWAILSEGINLYGEWYLSSKNHPGAIYDREGYILIDKLPESLNISGVGALFEYIDVKAGHFEPDFGNNHLVRSDNGQVDKNPLVGNYVADPNTAESGFEIIGHAGQLHGLVGIGDGVTVEDYRNTRGFSTHAKVWVEPEDHFYNLAASYYTVNHSGNPTKALGGTWSELFAGNRSGSQYGGFLWTATTEATRKTDPGYGQPNMGEGKLVSAWQVDASINFPRIKMIGNYGFTRDADINGSAAGGPEDIWTYFGIEGKAEATKNLYLAARYSNAASSKYKNVSTDARIDRLQAGFGYWATNNVLMKTEYVFQKYNGFPSDYTTNPSFSGLIVQIATMLDF